MSMPWALSATKPRTGARLNKASDSWSRSRPPFRTRPQATAAAACAVDFQLAPGASKTVRYLMAWCAPQWKGATKTMGIGIGQKFEGQWLVNKHAGDVSYYTHVCFQVGGCSM